jgi:hypothetical protein
MSEGRRVPVALCGLGAQSREQGRAISSPDRQHRCASAAQRWLAPLLLSAATTLAAAEPDTAALPGVLDGSIDVRINAREHLRWQDASDAEARLRLGKSRRSIDQAIDGLLRQRPELELRRSAATGVVDVLYSRAGALSRVAPTQSSERIARAFLAEHRDIYGLSAEAVDQLVVLGDSPGGGSGLRMLRLEQQVAGLPVFESETRVLIDRDGRVWRVLGAFVSSAAAEAAMIDKASLMLPADALSHLLGWSGHAVRADEVRAKQAAARQYLLTAPAPVAGEASARLVLFPLASGALIPAWSLTVFTEASEDWYALVDARNGSLLWRRNLRDYASSQQARFAVYVQADGITPADSPAPKSPSPVLPGGGSQFPSIARSTVNMLDAQALAASPNGWIDDCPSAANGCDSTRGNNVEACLDRDATSNLCDSGALDADGRAQGNPDSAARNRDFLGSAPRDFEFTPAPAGGNPDAGDNPLNADAQRGALVQAFYTINWFHDRMLRFGFDEASGNFQQVNLLGQGGLGGDRIAADIQNTGLNTASFSTPADGAGPGRLELSIFSGPTPDRDSALDAGIVIHELSHGMSHRLIGNSQGLLWDVARSMGEGWSDFFALALLNNSNADDPLGRYPFAPWVSYRLSAMTDNYLYGFRRFPYAIEAGFNPLSFSDVDAVTADESGGIAASPLNLGASGALEVHNAGSVWAQTLWRIRAGIIANSAGDVPAGNEVMLQLVVDAMKLTPAHPSLIDGRDALIAADCATNGCANEREIWEGFAAMELGYRALAPLAVGGRFARAHMGIGISRELPHLDVLNVDSDVVVTDTGTGNGNGVLDPGESVQLLVTISNPLRLADLDAMAVFATLSTASPLVQISDGEAFYGDIAAQAAASNAAAPFLLSIDPAAPCGSRIEFDLQTASTLGTRTAKFSLRIGSRGGVGAPIVFTQTPALMIPVSSVDGVAATLNIADDHEIADLDLRIDQLSHPVTGHLSVMLRAPSGYGSDLIFKRGGFLVPNQGGGANFSNLVIDDDLPLLASEDLNQSLSTQAPFSGDWLPAFNAPFWSSYRPSPPNPPAQVASDPIGQLGRLDGSSSKGPWTLSVANGSSTLTGTLDVWSLIVRPRLFSCSIFVPGDSLFGSGFE